MFNSHTETTAALYFTILPLPKFFQTTYIAAKGDFQGMSIHLHAHKIHITSNCMEVHEMSLKESFSATLLCCFYYDHHRGINTQTKAIISTTEVLQTKKSNHFTCQLI
jgi:hypothetical protein